MLEGIEIAGKLTILVIANGYLIKIDSIQDTTYTKTKEELLTLIEEWIKVEEFIDG